MHPAGETALVLGQHDNLAMALGLAMQAPPARVCVN
jgi:hypothetical protein